MKKLACILGTFLLTGCSAKSSIGVIGGADGPTSIYVSSVRLSLWPFVLLAGAAIAATAVILVRKNKK